MLPSPALREGKTEPAPGLTSIKGVPLGWGGRACCGRGGGHAPHQYSEVDWTQGISALDLEAATGKGALLNTPPLPPATADWPLESQRSIWEGWLGC